jgi:hypothetical protein
MNYIFTRDKYPYLSIPNTCNPDTSLDITSNTS